MNKSSVHGIPGLEHPTSKLLYLSQLYILLINADVYKPYSHVFPNTTTLSILIEALQIILAGWSISCKL